jgi:hypothetical protein
MPNSQTTTRSSSIFGLALPSAEKGKVGMHRLAELQSKRGTTTLVGYDFASSFEDLVMRGDADSFIVSTEDGFSPLGMARKFFAETLGIDQSAIRKIADWNRFENNEVSLIELSSGIPSSKLRGVILAAGETSRCYEQFSQPRYGKPYRDFYYNVAYESISHAANAFGARKIAMSHLSGSGCFHEDIAICIAEALGHFCDNPAEPEIDSFMFVGCCVDVKHLSGIQRLNNEGRVTSHRGIRTWVTMKDGFKVINLDWR